jgi:hypothetical protein
MLAHPEQKATIARIKTCKHFRPIKHMTQSFWKIALEFIVAPSELLKILSGLQNFNKSCPIYKLRVECDKTHSPVL